MSPDIQDKLVIAISSRALFDLDASHRVFVEQGVDAYCRYQIEHEDDILAPDIAFPLVKKLAEWGWRREGGRGHQGRASGHDCARSSRQLAR